MWRIAGFALLASLSTACGTKSVPAAPPPITLGMSATHVLPLPWGKESLRLSVVLPRGYTKDSTRRFPVVYLLDGNELAPVGAGVANDLSYDGVPQALLVGIDYDVPDLRGSATARMRDLTPTPDTSDLGWQRPYWEAEGDTLPRTTGKAGDLLRLIADSVVPLIDRTYRTLPNDRTLLGYSAGGLFTLYALTERPTLFQRYVAGSPSLWWDHEYMLGKMAEFLKQPAIRPTRLFVSIGLDEGSDTLVTMVPNVRALEQSLKAHVPTGLSWHVQYFPDERHASGWPGAMSRGLRYAFEAWPPKEKAP